MFNYQTKIDPKLVEDIIVGTVLPLGSVRGMKNLIETNTIYDNAIFLNIVARGVFTILFIYLK